MHARIKIIVAEDNAVFRENLAKLLADEPDMEIIGRAGDGDEALKLTKELLPDVVLMDIGMPGLNGIGATRLIHKDLPGVRVIVLSAHSSKSFIKEMFTAGASGFLPKECEYDELINAVRVVAYGQKYISPVITDSVIKDFISGSDTQTSTDDRAL